MWKLRQQQLVGVMVSCGAALALVVACSSSDDSSTGATAGAAGTGGSGNTSGASSGGKGGAATGGGSGSSNGGSSSAGASASGGSANVGGASDNGGEAGEAGGGAANGGASVGGTGGAAVAGSGGAAVAGSGGAATAGTGGAATGGTGGAAVAGSGGAATAGTGGAATAGTGGAATAGTGGAATAGTGGAATAGTGGAATGGSGGSGGFTPVAITLLNPGFETGYGDTNGTVQDWQTSGTAASYIGYTPSSSAYDGYGRLAFFLATPYQTATFQTVTGLTNGTYTLAAWVEGASTGVNALYIYATGYNSSSPSDQLKTDIAVTTSYVQYSLTDIPVTSGTLTIGIYADETANNWVNADDFTLYRVE